MDMIRVSMLGMLAVCLALFLKNGRQEYGIYICIVTCVIIFSYVLSEVGRVRQVIIQIRDYLDVSGEYMETLFKMAGITYLAEFSANICKDSGFSALASQIELFGKLSVLLLSLPVMLAILNLITEFLV